MTAPNKMMNAAGKLRSRMTKKSPALLSRESTGTQSSGDLSSREPVQVEPKTYFANERTFIQWISAALLLLTVSSIMMGSGSYNGTSSVIAFSSLVLVVYASYVYFRRVKLLRSGNAYGYLDFVGPAILAAGVGLGVFIVFADAVKGSEFLPFGGEGKDKDDDRRFLLSSRVISSPQVPELQPEMRAMDPIFKLQEDVDGKCTRHSIEGINLLEYQPRDIVLSAHHQSELLVATPQALVSHPLWDKAGGSSSFLLSELPDTEIQSMTLVGDRLFALSMGPSQTELIEFKNASSDVAEKLMESNRFLIQDSTSTTGSMVFVPSSSVAGEEEEEGKLFIYLDGSLHSYHLPSNRNAHHASSSPKESLIRTGGINMKVLNHRGLTLVDNHNSNSEEEDPITDMEYFEGLTYVLRERQNTIEAWDLNRATMVAELLLPPVAKQDKWVGMAFQRGRSENDDKSFLRKSPKAAADASSVYLHMPLDSFPPQLWSFRLVEHDDDKDEERTVFSFPECDGGAMN